MATETPEGVRDSWGGAKQDTWTIWGANGGRLMFQAFEGHGGFGESPYRVTVTMIGNNNPPSVATLSLDEDSFPLLLEALQAVQAVTRSGR